MTDQNNQEPTMEEILASIRRIISEDDPPAAGAEEAAPAAAAPAAAPAAPQLVAAAPAPVAEPEKPQPEPEEAEEDDVLELTDRVSAQAPAPAVQSMGDLDVFSAPAAEPAPAPERSVSPAAPTRASETDSLVSSPAASVAASSFAALSGAIHMPREGRQLEDVVRELLRPLMKQWLDENLPRIVESAVQSEVDRIARLHR